MMEPCYRLYYTIDDAWLYTTFHVNALHYAYTTSDDVCYKHTFIDEYISFEAML